MLQVSLLPALRPLGVVPYLALVLVVLVGLEGTASLALAIAVAGGLVLDIASGTNFGLWTGTLVLAAIVTGLLHRAGVELVGAVVASVMVAVGTLLMTLVIWLGLATSISHWPLPWMFGHLWIELVLNLGLVLAVRPLVRLVVPSGHPGEVMVG
jgi:hypothetical protein